MAVDHIVAIYIHRETFKPMIWGVNDCCLFIANLAVELGFDDPAERFRNQYDDEVGAVRFVEEAGGIVRLINQSLASVGIGKTKKPTNGDCGCVHVNDETMGAIYYADTWWIKANDGLIACPPDEVRVLGVWQLSREEQCLQ